jgi:hypothetical protein
MMRLIHPRDFTFTHCGAAAGVYQTNNTYTYNRTKRRRHSAQRGRKKILGDKCYETNVPATNPSRATGNLYSPFLAMPVPAFYGVRELIAGKIQDGKQVTRSVTDIKTENRIH